MATALAALIVGGMFVWLVLAVGELRSSADRARHSEQVLASANSLEKVELDTETGMRGYVITHDPGFLAPWMAARSDAPGQIAQLERLVQDNPAQEARALRIGRLINSYIQEYSDHVVDVARTSPARATALIRQGDGKRRVDELRRDFTLFRAVEQGLATSRRVHADAQARRAVQVAVAGLLGTLALVFLFAFYLSHGIGGPVRRLALAAGRLRDGDLSARVPPGGAGEIRGLVDDFNAMGAGLVENREELEGQNAELEAQQSELEAQQSELEDALEALGAEQERMAAAYSFGRRLMAEIEVQAVIGATLDAICAYGRADVAAFYAAEQTDDDTLVLAGTRTVDPATLPGRLGEHGVAARAAAEQRALAVSYGSTGLTLEAFGTEVRVAHELHVPLIAGGHTLAVLTMGRAADEPFGPDEIEGAEHLAAQAGIALAQALGFAAAKEQATITAAILDATTDGITLIGPGGEFVFSNAAARRIAELHSTSLDTSFGEVTGGVAELTTNPTAYRAAAAARAEHPEREATHEHELAESGLSFRTYTAPVEKSDGSLLGQIVIVRETTAEREGERLKSELLATVSHELRTPLTGVLGFAELLLRQDVDVDTRRQYITTIHREARRLTALINDFLDLQRIEEGRLTLALDTVDLTAMLRRSVELFRAQSAAHEVELIVPDKPLAVLGEGGRIEQVLANLLSNAIKYSPGGGTVSVSVQVKAGFTRVSVTDPGLGIPLEQQARIFQKFFRVDSSDTREIGGTGLGLALSREIVEAHGGSIGFESLEGRGSTFWFELPSGRREGVGHTTGHVLVVEDDPAAAALMAEYLSLDGFRVEIASTGERALQLAWAEPPVLVCLDMALPGEVDGWQVLSELRANPATAEVPVVICTANNGRNRAATLGASDFLTKPFSAELLRTAVGRLLTDRTGSVLVVDDEPAIRRLVIETLGGDGLEFREAADGEQALAAIGERRPSAVVLDLMLPKLDGFTVLERLQDDPETRSIPVVVLTGSALSAAERRRLSSAAVALLDKCEYSGRELRGLVERALRV